eukprot:1633286-Prymnesium_polylepis.1
MGELTLNRNYLRGANWTISAIGTEGGVAAPFTLTVGTLYISGGGAAGANGVSQFTMADVNFAYRGRTVQSASIDVASSSGAAMSDVVNITMPIPLMLLHNTSSPHAAAAFLGELTSAAWLEAWADWIAPPPPANGSPPPPKPHYR